MATEDEWVKRLDSQWLSLRRTEDVLSMLQEDGGDVSLTRSNLNRYAHEYGRSVVQAPRVALLRHARNTGMICPD